MIVRKNYVPFNDKPVVMFPIQGRTKQSFREECDINNIMRKYMKTGQLAGLIKSNPQYGDFSSMGSYQESLDLVMMAQAQFDSLPAPLRFRFGNDPASFLAFANDPRNNAELVNMGLATPKGGSPVIEHPRASNEVSMPGSDKKTQVPPAKEGPNA